MRVIQYAANSRSITVAADCWVTRWSLWSGGASRRPGRWWWHRRCGNGYRSAKRQGKPNFTNRHFPLSRRHFCDSMFSRAMRAFTPRSSRTLNCPSNLIGHDHPNKPANGTRLIRQSAGGLAIRSRALLIGGARSDARPAPTFADRALGWQAFQNWTGAALGGGRQR